MDTITRKGERAAQVSVELITLLFAIILLSSFFFSWFFSVPFYSLPFPFFFFLLVFALFLFCSVRSYFSSLHSFFFLAVYLCFVLSIYFSLASVSVVNLGFIHLVDNDQDCIPWGSVNMRQPIHIHKNTHIITCEICYLQSYGFTTELYGQSLRRQGRCSSCFPDKIGCCRPGPEIFQS